MRTKVVRSTGTPPSVNLKFYFDGEEEAGDAHARAMLERHAPLLASDGWVFADGPVHQSRRQQVVLGVRGVTDVVITVVALHPQLHAIAVKAKWSDPAAAQRHRQSGGQPVDDLAMRRRHVLQPARLDRAERVRADPQ